MKAEGGAHAALISALLLAGSCGGEAARIHRVAGSEGSGALRGGGGSGSSNRVAVVITLTKDGATTGYLDGAAVLKESIEATGSKYNITFIAIVHPQVQKSRVALRKLGYAVHEKAWPFNSSGIKRAHLRETIDKSGCCGMAELIKLRAYEFVDYRKVLLLDTDSLIFRNIDELFEAPEALLFTYDRGMDIKSAVRPPAQGGFFVLTPSVREFERLVETVREGDFRPGQGWGGKHIGWCYGGQTVQGLMSYYANVMLGPGQAKEMDSCIYNNMASNVNAANRTQADVQASEIKSSHFTVCQKPWLPWCGAGPTVACEAMHEAWWAHRQAFERKRGLRTSRRCGVAGTPGTYPPVDFESLSEP